MNHDFEKKTAPAELALDDLESVSGGFLNLGPQGWTCKVCNTRYTWDSETCPKCGTHRPDINAAAGLKEVPDPVP